MYYGTTEPPLVPSPSKCNIGQSKAKFLPPTIDKGAIQVAQWIARTEIPLKWKDHADTMENCIAKWAATEDAEQNLTATISDEMSRMFSYDEKPVKVLHQASVSSDSQKQRQTRDVVLYSKVC